MITGAECVIRGCRETRMVWGRKGGGKVEMDICPRHWGQKARAAQVVRRIEIPEGTRKQQHDGYMQIRVNGQWRPEHRVVMEAKLGRPLVKGESVHHINGIRDDNRPENLELWLNWTRYGQRATDVHCPHCGRAYLEEASR